MTSSTMVASRATEVGMDADAQLVLDMIRAVEERDMEALTTAYHPDVEFVWPPGLPYGGTFRNDEVAAMTEAFAAAWEPLQPDAETRRLDPRVLGRSSAGEVVVHYVQRGRYDDGRSCETPVLGLYTVTDGKVRRLQMFYFDPAGTAEFLRGAAVEGGAPPPSRPESP